MKRLLASIVIWALCVAALTWGLSLAGVEIPWIGSSLGRALIVGAAFGAVWGVQLMRSTEHTCPQCGMSISGTYSQCLACGAPFHHTHTSGVPASDAATPTHARTSGGASYELVLESTGARPVVVIKAIVDTAGLTLKEAMKLTKSAPCVVWQSSDAQAIQEVACAFQDAGALVSVRSPRGLPPITLTTDGQADGYASAIKTGTWDVVLEHVGTELIAVIKAVREFSGMSLKEAKDAADTAPTVVLENASEERARKLESALRSAGATVTVRS